MASLVLVSLVAGLVEALFLVVVTRAAFAISEGSDRVSIFGGRSTTVLTAATVALLLVVIRIAFSVLGSWSAAKLDAVTVAGMRRRLAAAFLHSSWTAQHGQRSGRLQDLLTNFTNQGSYLVGGFTGVVLAGCNLAVLLAVAVGVDPTAAFALIVAVGLLGLLLRPLRSAVGRQAARVGESGVEYAGALGEISQLGLEMHVFDVQDKAEREVSELIGRHERATRRLDFLRSSVPTLYTGVAYLALVGALAAVASIESASLVSVGAIMLLMLRSLSYGLALQASITQMISARPFLDVLSAEFERYDSARVRDSGEPVLHVGDVELRGVCFEYEPGARVLTWVDAVIPAREIVGVVGPSGSGKSTLVQLLLGLRDPTEGVVLADGRDLRRLAKSEWARKVTFVPQEPQLIAGTVADNIRFYRDGVSSADIERAAEQANLHGDVRGWSEGYERQVGERGSHLSGGQQQRLIIARALVENPELLILDEPTSALDVRSEHLIRQTLDALRDRMTIVIIAHRLSTLDICDRIMVIQDGEMKAFDTPERLAETSDFYQDALRISGMR